MNEYRGWGWEIFPCGFAVQEKDKPCYIFIVDLASIWHILELYYLNLLVIDFLPQLPLLYFIHIFSLHNRAKLNCLNKPLQPETNGFLEQTSWILCRRGGEKL